MTVFRHQWRSPVSLIPLIGPDGSQWLPVHTAPDGTIGAAARHTVRRNN